MESVVANLIRALFFLGLFLCFIFHANLQFKKFLHGDTTLATRALNMEKLKYPVITLCPTYSFKTDVIKLAGFPPNFWMSLSPEDWNPNMTIKDWKDFLDNSTYRIDELASSIKLHNGFVIDKLELKDNELITIKKVPTSYRGICYSISLNLLTESPTDYVKIYFKHPSKENDLNIFYHEAFEETYLMAFDYWIMQPNMQILKSEYGYSNELVVKHHWKKPGTANCNEKATTKTQHYCIAQEIIEKCKPCSFPFHSILQEIEKKLEQKTKICSSPLELKDSQNCISKTIINSRKSKCLRPCSLWMLELYPRQKPLHGLVVNESVISFYYRHLEVEESKEYVLVDFVTALSGIGGSMGIFLGFSFLDIGFNIIKWIISKT